MLRAFSRVVDLRLLSPGTSRLISRGPVDVDDAQQELDEFFGSKYTAGTAQDAAAGNAAQQPWAASNISSNSSPDAVTEGIFERHESAVSSSKLTHVDEAGHASMVDVAQKYDTLREARASAYVRLGATAFHALRTDSLSKGALSHVLATAELAGTMAAKQTPALIPLCHPLLLTRAAVRAAADPEGLGVAVTADVRTVGKTGVEMEALTAAAVAALTVVDMCKAASKDIVVERVQLEAKSGGKSGDYVREA